jgi:hypothetical protein
MSFDKHNTEGYSDPTAYNALMNVLREEKDKKTFKPLVFICSPYAGNVEENVSRALRFCRFAVDSGYIPMAPHLHYPRFLDEANPEERSLGLFMGLVWLTKCAELWVCGCRISRVWRRRYEKPNPAT